MIPLRGLHSCKPAIQHKIDLILNVEGTLRQEQSLHGALTERFGRLRIPCPPNEWLLKIVRRADPYSRTGHVGWLDGSS